MTFDKISLTLFDVLSYLLPGYILLFSFSIIEATFFDTSLFSLSTLNANWLTSSIMAYFLGQISHRLGSLLKNRKNKWFENRKQQLSRPLYYHARDLLSQMYDIKFEEGERLQSLETYMLAESYIIASGKTDERDSLIAREGFHKTSMSSFGIATALVFATLFVGGVNVQVTPGVYISMTRWETFGVVIVFAIFTAVFWQGYVFYNRLKINNILLLAMTLRSLDKEKSEKQAKEN
jgi:hypothetical protein